MQGQWLLPHKEMKMEKTFFGLMAIAVLAFALTGCDNGGGHGPEAGYIGGVLAPDFTGSITLTNVPAGVTVYITGNPEGHEPFDYRDERDDKRHLKVNVNEGGDFLIPNDSFSFKDLPSVNGFGSGFDFHFHLFVVKSLDLTPNSISYSYARIDTGIRKTKLLSDNNRDLGNVGSFRLPDLVTISGTINASLNKFFPSAAIDWEDESEGIVSVYRQEREIYQAYGTGSSEAAWSLLVPASKSISLDCRIFRDEINPFSRILSSTAYPVNTSNQNQTGIDINMGNWITLWGSVGYGFSIEVRAENNSVLGEGRNYIDGYPISLWSFIIPASSSYRTVKFYTKRYGTYTFLDTGVTRSVSDMPVTGIDLGN
jgi:hypothetical protein